MAVAYLNQNKNEKGIEYLNRAFEINNDDVYAWALKGDIETKQEKFKDAEKSYSKTIKYSYPTSIENQYARLCRALTQAYQADFNSAWKDIRRVKLSGGDNSSVHHVSGIIAFLAKDYIKAQAELEKIRTDEHNQVMIAHLLQLIQQHESLQTVLQSKSQVTSVFPDQEILPYGIIQLKLGSCPVGDYIAVLN